MGNFHGFILNCTQKFKYPNNALIYVQKAYRISGLEKKFNNEYIDYKSLPQEFSLSNMVIYHKVHYK